VNFALEVGRGEGCVFLLFAGIQRKPWPSEGIDAFQQGDISLDVVVGSIRQSRSPISRRIKGACGANNTLQGNVWLADCR